LILGNGHDCAGGAKDEGGRRSRMLADEASRTRKNAPSTVAISTVTRENRRHFDGDEGEPSPSVAVTLLTKDPQRRRSVGTALFNQKMRSKNERKIWGQKMRSTVGAKKWDQQMRPKVDIKSCGHLPDLG
jgi:hypothetical protein